MSLVVVVRRFMSRRLVRPWALSAPILILAISIPLLQPLRTPDPSRINDDEQATLATVQAIVEQGSLEIERTEFRGTRSRIRRAGASGNNSARHYYSNQPPMLAVLASGPYWLLHHLGVSFDRHPHLTIFLLTLFMVTLPVALSAGFVYRMGRIFELKRPLRAALALTVVLASGLISYSTVLNPHALAAALLLGAAASLTHVIAHKQPRIAIAWLGLTGVCAALAAALDPPALAFLLLFILVIAALRWPNSMRCAGIIVYLLGAAIPLTVHAKLTHPITGDLRPGIFHPELAPTPEPLPAPPASQTPQIPGPAATVAPAPPQIVEIPSTSSQTPTSLSSPRDEGDEPPTIWQKFLDACYHILGAFIGRHGVFSHFPVVLLGIIGVTMIMHRHWPAPTKMLAGVTLGGALTIILICALSRSIADNAMFATRWFVVFLPQTLFWSGAWLRRSHRQSSWIMAGTLLGFSVIVSLIGATGPLPRDGFHHYTVGGAWHNLTHRSEAPPPRSSLGGERGSENAVAR